MYKKMLVPLDGSELAECVLPHLEAMIRNCGVQEAMLVRVLEPRTSPQAEASIEPAILAQVEKARREAAEDYLKGICERYKNEAALVRYEVVSGRVAESLVDYAAAKGADLILIATHGRSGVTRWVRGSVADKILHSSRVPVLMVRAPGSEPGS